MDDIRNWILIIGSVLLAAVLVHALWLAWSNRRTKARIEIDGDAPTEEFDELLLLRAELPSGGARVVSRDGQRDSTRRTDLDLDQQVPVLMEPVAEAGGETRVAPVLERERRRSPENVSSATSAEDVGTIDPEWGEFDELVVINVIARNEGFAGADIVDLAGKHGLKFGDMNIFHRYARGKRSLDGIRFSMASAVEPGTFDLGTLDESTTAGVSLFMRLPGPDGPMSAFEEMLRVAKDIAERFDGDLRDEQRSMMTPQTIEHCRQRIHEFTRKRLMHRA